VLFKITNSYIIPDVLNVHIKSYIKITIMNNFLRGLLSGYGAWKLGGGCLGTIVVFVVLWLLLGKCS
jgi:hypothetical protein